MTNKTEVNCIFALHFDDKDDPRYREIVKLLFGDLWIKGNLVAPMHCKSRDEMERIMGVEYE